MSEGRVFGERRGDVEVVETVAEPISFTIVGYHRTDVDDDGKPVEGRWTFKARGSAPLGSIMEVLHAAHGDRAAGAQLIRLFMSCLAGDAERQRFGELMDTETYDVDRMLLGEIVEWLNEQWTGTPFRLAAGSSPGSTGRVTGSGSRGASRKRAS